MTEEEIKELEREVRRCKRIAGEQAAQLHDLIEDRLPAAYLELPALARATFDACKAWADAQAQLESLSHS